MQEQKLPILLLEQLSACGHKNIAVCTNPECLTSAFICDHEKCINSSMFHEKCTKVIPQHFVRVIQSQRSVMTAQAKDYFQKIQNIYQKMIQILSIQKNDFLQSVDMFGMKPYTIKMIQKIKNHQSEEISGNQIMKVYTEIADNWGNKQLPYKENVEQFWNKNRTKFQKMLEQLESLRFAPQTIFPSKIVQPQKINHILSFFNKPIKQFNLLFRASANNYSSAEFTKICKDIPDTLIVVKTADRIFGGYTPVKWEQSSFAREKADYTGQSFLFSLDFLEKYPLKNKHKAIRCWKSSGPTFGEGDLFIVDSCNRNNSVTQFPISYAQNKSQPQQNKFHIFSGRKNQARFLVQDYEVYQIIWKQYVQHQEILKLGEKDNI